MKLHLEDGTKIEGKSFGANPPRGGQLGEVVFNTGMVGYVESLTDPSYAGQIVVLTYPLAGNYGVPAPDSFESKKIQVAGLIVAEYCEKYSHANAVQSLGSWLKKSGVPAMQDVDTRALTKKLREHGVMLGCLANFPIGHRMSNFRFSDPNEENLVAKVSTTRKEIRGKGKLRIVAVDCGMKENIMRSLVRPETTVIRVPWDYDFTREQYDGLVLSNGPGDPTQCTKTIEHIRKAMSATKPILGVCLGNQLLALAAGARTYKLKYGHRGHNQPCILRHRLGQVIRGLTSDTLVGRCFITSQNHGFAVDIKTLPNDWQEWFVNANDGSNEGILHKTKPWRSVQFHPEASPGPTDTAWIFDDFITDLKKRA